MAVVAEADVVVVGAGLAGLRCAHELERAGLDVVVLDREDAPGGRIRTAVVDGHLVDRGFQLLNPGYPAVRRWVDTAALDLHAFDAGVAARGADGVRRLGHPWHAPGLLPASVRAVAGSVPGTLGLLRWAAPLLTPGRGSLGRRLAARPDATLAASLDAAGVGGLPRTVLDRFLAGVLLEDAGASSAQYARLLVSSFLQATPALPRDGMEALPRQLAARLSGPVRTGVEVEAVERSTGSGGPRVRTAGGEYVARAVVVATAAPGAEALLGVPAPASHGVVTEWYSTTEPPAPRDRARLLHVDGRGRPHGPLVNAAVMSAAAPSYAPPGRHLIGASALLGPDRPVPSAAMHDHAGELLGSDPRGWELLRRDEVPHALPAQEPPLTLTRPTDLGDGVFVAGDHRDTASIQGALVSGHRAATAVRRAIGGAA
ncbi:FAD-dependent oxidoreductase [Nocardioides sp. ChNu-153]|uniref:FAD-dependent oxidoreductase n=1 Tax=Nocardioides sp. ChNu-153 TaxID=2779364 RepID=UPI00265505E8|nr:FAD-dependent oxidoreductase [Nocardioides sp. ChNu-153]MDN7121488.1 FAD-dependent oxidoreductase [Nocardioides sp. ChNu-153]